MNSNEYYYCSECCVWVPFYVSDLHIRCHKTTIHGIIHSLVRDGQIIGKVGIIKKKSCQTSVQKDFISTQRSWKVYDEPEIMQKMEVKFADKFCFISEADLFCSGIEGFTSVIVRAKELKGTFITVPCRTLQNGIICLYEEGIMRHLPIPQDVTHISVEKVSSCLVGREITIKSSKSKDNCYVSKCFKRKFLPAYDYGIPLLFEKSNTISLFSGREGETLYEMTIDDPNPCSSTLEASYQGTTNEVALNESLSSKDGFNVDSLVPAFESFNVGDLEHNTDPELSKIEGMTPTTSTPRFKTSTPRDEEEQSFSYTKKRRTKRRHRNAKDKSNTSIVPFSEAFAKQDVFRLAKDVKIQIVTEEENTSNTEQRTENGIFFQDDNMFHLQNLIEKKALYWSEGRELHCPWTAILLSGLPGTGKTHLVKELSKKLGFHLVTVSLLGWAFSSSSSTFVEECFNEAKNRAPSLLLVEEIDSLCHATHGRNQAQFSTKILKFITKSKTWTKPVIVIGTSNRSETVPDAMKRTGRFDREVTLALPSPETRGTMLWHLLGTLRHSLTREEVTSLGERAAGLSKADLDCVIRVAWQKAVDRWRHEKTSNEPKAELKLKLNDLELGMTSVIPTFLKQSYSAVSEVKWTDIYGYDNIKDKLKKMVERSPAQSHRPRGVLLYGPPGCSKTMMVRALASETRFTFFPVKCSDLLSKYVGETEKSLCQVFKRASLSAPSLIFMDEIDSLCGRRSGAGSQNSVVSELLPLLQRSLREDAIYVIGASNRPQVLDEAFFCPGALELMLHVDLPDCSSRCALWEGLLKPSGTCERVDIKRLCHKTEGFSCAEIRFTYESAAHSLLNSMHSNDEKKLNSWEEFLLTAIDSTVPRTSEALLSAIKSFRNSQIKIDNR